MTKDNGKMQEETMAQALAVVTAHVLDDDALLRSTVRQVKEELEASTEDDRARMFVYIYQSARLTEIALDLAVMTTGKTKAEVLRALAASITSIGFADPDE